MSDQLRIEIQKDLQELRSDINALGERAQIIADKFSQLKVDSQFVNPVAIQAKSVLDLSKGNDFKDWFTHDLAWQSGLDFIELQDDYLRQTYRPTSKGSDRVQAMTKMPNEYRNEQALTISFEVNFETGFEWVKGGKFGFGLYGGFRSSDHAAGGGNNFPDACIVRCMWRPNGFVGAYYYRQNKPVGTHIYGEDLLSPVKIQTNKWHKITLAIELNSNHNAKDGRLSFQLDNNNIQFKSDIEWISAGKIDFNNLVFSSFYGGNTPNWAPSKNTFARFRNLTLSKEFNA